MEYLYLNEKIIFFLSWLDHLMFWQRTQRFHPVLNTYQSWRYKTFQCWCFLTYSSANIILLNSVFLEIFHVQIDLSNFFSHIFLYYVNKIYRFWGVSWYQCHSDWKERRFIENDNSSIIVLFYAIVLMTK